MGRDAYQPSKEHIQCAYNGARKGLNGEEIAKAIGISYATFNRYKDNFREAIKKGKDEADDLNITKAENALMRAIDRKQPNATLTMFYLVNRSPRWHSINLRDDKGSVPPDKLEKAMQSMSEIMDMTHKGGERPGNDK